MLYGFVPSNDHLKNVNSVQKTSDFRAATWNRVECTRAPQSPFRVLPRAMTTAFDSKSYTPTAADIRRRTCVVCGVATPNSYVTSFTRVPERQEEWVSLLANGDLEFSLDLKTKLAQGRKYLCLDHFDRHQLTTRKNGDGIEILRNSSPMPFKNAEFTRKHHDEILNSPPSITQVNTDPIPEKRQKMPSETEYVPIQPNGNSMALLMNTINFYVEQSMNAATLAKKNTEAMS